MSTLTIWLLLAFSNGTYNRGTVTVVEKFESQAVCAAMVKRLDALKQAATFACVLAKGTP